MNTTDTTDTRTSTRHAKRMSYARKTQGSFRVKDENSNVVVNVKRFTLITYTNGIYNNFEIREFVDNIEWFGSTTFYSNSVNVMDIVRITEEMARRGMEFEVEYENGFRFSEFETVVVSDPNNDSRN